jgi:UDP-GlcNAc:undecaprenyl-phosphate GlcNAc-1-phosphate transferase
MDIRYIFFHFLFASVLVGISIVVTILVLRHLKVFDVPNERSSHTKVTPRGGGIAIVVAFLFGISLIHTVGDKTPIYTPYFLGFLVSAFVLAAIALYDDFHTVSFKFKLGGQIVSIIAALMAGIVIDEVHVPVFGVVDFGIWAYPLTFVWLLGLTNAYNFIDGLDGLAASTALIAALFLAYISFVHGSHFIYLTALSLAAATAGFLIFNWSPAKIFMGDVGSTFLGYTFAIMAVIAARYDHSHTSLFVVPMLLFHILYDTVFTFLRRLFAGDHVFTAHRTHLYQLLNRIGCSHKAVAYIYSFLAVVQGVTAAWMVSSLGAERVYVFMPFLIVYSLCAVLVLAMTKHKGIVL